MTFGLDAGGGRRDIYPRGNGGLVTAPDGTVIAMNELSVVRLTSSGAQTLASFSPVTVGGIRGSSPDGIAVGSDGSIYVDTFYGNGFADRSAILRLAPSGQPASVLWESTDQPIGLLSGNGVNGTHFGDTQTAVTATLNQVFGQPTATQSFNNPGNCSIDASIRWGEVTTFYSQGHFVGYRALGADANYPSGGGFSFGGAGKEAQTQLGLRVGDPRPRAEPARLGLDHLHRPGVVLGSHDAGGAPTGLSLWGPRPAVAAIPSAAHREHRGGRRGVPCRLAVVERGPRAAPHRALRGAML